MHGLVLTAAGRSTRFGGARCKVLEDLGGMPVVAHALRAFQAAVPGLAVVVTAPADACAEMAEALPGTTVIAGGSTRQASVQRGMAALPADVDIILVHDGARPLIDAATILAVLQTAREHGAALAATAVSDSLHRIEGGAESSGIDGRADRHRLQAPISRADVVAAQTPQAAQAALLRRAFAKADADGFVGTDEAALLAHAGIPVVACLGPATNLKITTPGDLAVASQQLAARAAAGLTSPTEGGPHGA